MSSKLEEIDLRSEEIQEILTRVPNWMIRWGSALFLALIILVVVISWFVKYPDVIETEALLTTKTPPQKEFAGSTSKLDTIFVRDSQLVEKNALLAILDNSANAKDVYYLKYILDTINVRNQEIYFPIYEMPILLLGEVENAYATFENNYSDYILNKALSPFNNEAIANKTSLNELKIRLENMQSQYSLNLREFKLKKKDLDRNESLYKKGVISQLDFEKKQLEILNSEKGLKDLGNLISQTRQSIANAARDVKGTQISRTTGEAKLMRNVLQSFIQLKKSIRDWEDRFVLKSEIEGQVSFLNYWSNTQTVNKGDLVFTIIPKDNQSYLAKVRAAPQNSGKIKLGQSVNLKLKSFPETEFGMLKGKVKFISLSPDKEGFYLVDVSVPNNLVTTYNKKIEFKQEMRGTAEIITEDLRLLERFFYQFKQLFDN
ncbi:HlyD family secretion protein [Maribacter sp. 2307UL18-2]|uniref:HlyD family secretion protein n=1 Tax=Maribacter sp. 2307UL18-2 TaxID=3386274 RepID=UPI0039BCC563